MVGIMSNELQRLLTLSNKIKVSLAQIDGTTWKESAGELQAPDMVVWILLFEDSDLEQAHRDFYSVISSQNNIIESLNFVVYYTLTTDEGIFGMSISGNENVSSAAQPGELSKYRWFPLRRLSSFFTSRNSKREAGGLTPIH